MTDMVELPRSFPSTPEGELPGRYFRDVLGNFPTGVVVVTAQGADGDPIGMVVGSFTSVSLHPPMVAFLADRGSGTFPQIRDAGRFAVNVLASDQIGLCHAMATKGADRFRDVAWAPSPVSGAPVLDGVVAWVDCTMANVVDAGDHVIALGDVHDLSVVSAKTPLLFFRGGYGAFEPYAHRLNDWFIGWG